jgi:hypoxanthine phosphoribosyltransferase
MEKVYFNDFRYLRQKVYCKIKDYSQYKGIICPLYGGMYLADYIRRQTKLPVYFLRLESYNEREQKEIKVHSIPYLEEGKYLIVDDIYDTGKTIEWIKNNYHECEFDSMVLITKQNIDNLIFGKRVSQDKWVTFFWEIF